MKRRNFIKTSVAAGVASATFANMFDPFSIKAYANGPLLAKLAKAAGSSRKLVVIQLDGGNDGLNTIVPKENSDYFNSRSGIAINDSIPLTDTLGMHPSFQHMKQMYDDGTMAIVQNVGYDNPNRSHFRSTDIWFTGTDAQTVWDTGWLGRYLDIQHPNYPDVAPNHPLSLKIGTTTNLLIEGENLTMGMAVADPEQFYQIISKTDTSQGDPPDTSTPGGRELAYIRQIASEANVYAAPVRDAYNSTQNNDVYPDSTYGGRYNLSEQMKIIARLIGGGLETQIYIVQIRGFDTHAQQIDTHADLLSEINSAVYGFFEDLKLMGAADDVAAMTITEFGRRVRENGTAGTDHGTCAPMFFWGPQVVGGITGNDPDLVNLDNRGDMIAEFDFRRMYASVLQQWFSLTPSDAALALGGEFENVPLFLLDPTSTKPTSDITGFGLGQNYPNPVVGGATTAIPFATNGGRTTLRVYDIQGREVRTLLDSKLAPGQHEAKFHVNGLPSGTYIYRLESKGLHETRTLRVTK